MTTDTNKQPLPPAEWEEYFRKADLLCERLNSAKSERGKSTILGNFLGKLVGRQVPIEVGGRSGKAALRVERGRARRNLYYFEVSWDDVKPQVDGQLVGAKPKLRKRRTDNGPKRMDSDPGRKPAKTSASRKRPAGKVARSAAKDERKKGKRPAAARPQGHSAAGRGNNESW